MKRLPHVAMMLLAVALVAADKGEKKKSDFEKIQGKWMLVEHHTLGMKLTFKVKGEYTYTSVDETLGVKSKGEFSYTFSGKKLTALAGSYTSC